MSMYRRLIEASDAGDVAKLHNLIRDYPLLLKAAALANGVGDTPLHIACIGGHPHFIREVLNLAPEFALELNQDGASPLHIAAAIGNVEIAMELLGVGSHLCLVKGREKRVPLHFAVAKGRITVINELISLCQDSVTEVTARGETCFHLAVKSNKFEAFKVLCERVVSFGKEGVLNMKDDQGNTPLHLAASTKNYEVVQFLLEEKFYKRLKLEVNSTNKNGLTPLDVLESEGGDSEIHEMLTQIGATRGAPSLVIQTQEPSNDEPEAEQRTDHPKSAFQMLKDYFKYDRIRESPSKARNSLLVISVLIVTATYQAVLSPPGGVWQDNFSPANNAKQPPRHTAGLSIMATNNTVSYGLFLLFNSIGFFMSLHMMDILTHGLPLHFELRVALFALISTYNTCMLAITPNGKIYVSYIVFIVLMPLSLPMVTRFVRDFRKRR